MEIFMLNELVQKMVELQRILDLDDATSKSDRVRARELCSTVARQLLIRCWGIPSDTQKNVCEALARTAWMRPETSMIKMDPRLKKAFTEILVEQHCFFMGHGAPEVKYNESG